MNNLQHLNLIVLFTLCVLAKHSLLHKAGCENGSCDSKDETSDIQHGKAKYTGIVKNLHFFCSVYLVVFLH